VPSQDRPTSLRGLIGFLEHGGRVYQLVGYTKEDRWSANRPAMEAKLATFHAISDRAHLEVRPARVDLVELPERMTSPTSTSASPRPSISRPWRSPTVSRRT